MTKPLPMPDSHLLEFMSDIRQHGSEEAVAIPWPCLYPTSVHPGLVVMLYRNSNELMMGLTTS